MAQVTLPLTQGPENELGATVTTGLPQQRGHVALHSASAQRQAAGHGAIAEALQHEAEHPPLGTADADRA